MKTSEITTDRLRQVLRYEPEVGTFTWLVTTKRRKAGDLAGSTNVSGYLTIRVDGVLYLAHRLAWLYMTGEWPEALIDHINRARSDNRWVNLRTATHKVNANNRVNNAGNGGVYKDRGRFRAIRWVENRQVHMGCFGSIEEAKAALVTA